MLRGWRNAGIPLAHISVFDPRPQAWLTALVDQGLSLNTDPTERPDVVVLAVKPQVMQSALPQIAAYGNDTTLFISIAAGSPITLFERILGAKTPIIRAMPNTPAAIGKGITALVANKNVDAQSIETARHLMAAVGQTVVLDTEEQLHAVTALSGSGPAFVFAFAEALIKAGQQIGLSKALAENLAKATISGAGQLMESEDVTPAELRAQVTSPNGTTAAGLQALIGQGSLDQLVLATLTAAENRSREIAKAAD